MRAAVVQEFVAFSTQYEGAVDFMYLDVKGLVTTGVGDLIEPITLAQKLPWTCSYTRAATPSEVTAGWHAVKARQDLTQHGGMAYKNVCDLRLSQAAIADLVKQRLADNEAQLKHYLPGWDSFCADAQLGIMSMAWAVGSNFPRVFPSFTRAANAGNWLTAAAQSHISDGAVARNEANYYLFMAASQSQNPDILDWPPPPSSAA